MLPHSNFGIRMRRAKSKGYWWMKKTVKPQQTEVPAEDAKVVGISEVFKNLLRGKNEGQEK